MTSRQGFSSCGLWIILLFFLFNTLTFSQELPSKLIVGYWHNWWSDWPESFPLDEVDEGYDVINISFAIPTVPLGSTMDFAPDSLIYPNPQDFIDDVTAKQNQGKTVLISIGGATGPINLNDAGDVEAFVSSMIEIIDTYGFDGMDIDLEGSSLILNAGDTDYRNPTTPLIVNFIDAVQQLLDYYDDSFVLTAAPETAFVQGAYSYYGSVWGAYLPVIHAFRDELTYIHVQHYNTGSMFGRDGVLYEPTTADFHVAMADALIAGFPIAGGDYFDGLNPQQVAIGLPAGPSAAGSGYTEPGVVIQALEYLMTGTGFGGQYQLAAPEGYGDFRGLMTWSINWDVFYDSQFVHAYRDYLDGLISPVSISITPLDPPIVIPAGGGSFGYTAILSNNSPDTISFDAWIKVTIPSGLEYGPVQLKQGLVLNQGGTLTRELNQPVPGFAPAGEYTFTAYAGGYPTGDVIAQDSFHFTKLAVD